MARRSRPAGVRALGFAAVVAAATLAGALVDPVGHAQPAPDLERAKELYRNAEAAMNDGHFEDAVRDYGASYELSKDPALFFKIGRANERAGKCEVALIYYARYLHDGKPAEQFVATTRERMRACGGDVSNLGSATTVEPRPGSASDAGSAGPPADDSAASGAGSSAGSAGADGGAAGSASGSASAPEAATTATLVPNHQHKAAWILTGGGVALTTLGAILAFAASSSENDVRDLYVGFAGQPAEFNADTRKKYDDLVDQGRQFQRLSWASFGIAGAAAVGAAVLFVLGNREATAPRPRVMPIVTPTGAGVTVGF